MSGVELDLRDGLDERVVQLEHRIAAARAVCDQVPVDINSGLSRLAVRVRFALDGGLS